jgi:ankyrin repeat protein
LLTQIEREFQTALHDNDIKKVKLLISNGNVDPSYRYDYPIKITSRLGYIDIVKFLLKQPKVNPAGNNNYPLIFAIENGHTNIVNILLEDIRISPSKQIIPAINEAYNDNDIQMLKLIYENTEIITTVRNNDIELYNNIIQKNVKQKIRSF